MKLRLLDYVVICVIGLKVVFFYYLTEVTTASLVMGGLTIIVVGVIILEFTVSKKKNNSVGFGIFYGLLSAIMFIDALYYSYFNQLISVNQMFQLKSLIVVDGNSIKMAAPPISVLLLIDIPFIIVYYKRFKKRFVKMNPCRIKRVLKPITIVVSMTILAIAINPMQVKAFKAISKNEVVSYHINDLYSNIFNTEEVYFESDKAIKDYLKTLNKAKGNKYKGIAKGRNLIVIQVESLNNFVIGRGYNGQELTPNLNKLIEKDTIYCNNYYQTIGKGNTSDAEFSSQNSLYPVTEGGSYNLFEENTFYGLPWIMRANGYQTKVYHGYVGSFWNREAAYVNQGFEDFMSMDDMEDGERIAFGLSDVHMFEQTIEDIKKTPEPFYDFIITLSCHYPYVMPEAYQSITTPENEGIIFAQYINAAHYSDMAIGQFIEELKEAGLYENSIIAIYGDHHGLNANDDEINESMSRFLDKPYDYDEMLNIPLIIHIPNSGVTETIETVGGQVDFMPTIVNLMGVDTLTPYILGQDLINAEKGFVASITYMLRGSFIIDDVIYEASREGIYEYGRFVGEDPLDEQLFDKYEAYYEEALKRTQASKYILENNLMAE